MRRILTIIAALAVAFTVACSDSTDTPSNEEFIPADSADISGRVATYVEAWQEEADSGLTDVDVAYLAFAEVAADGTVTSPWVSPQAASTISRLADEGTQIALSVGGWGGSDADHQAILAGFAKATIDPEGFADEVMSAKDQVERELDVTIEAIDLDWEYPEPDQGPALASLVQALRQHEIPVTLAVPADIVSDGVGTYTAADQLSPLVSRVNVMAYGDGFNGQDAIVAATNWKQAFPADGQVHLGFPAYANRVSDGAEINLDDIPQDQVTDDLDSLSSWVTLDGTSASTASPAVASATLTSVHQFNPDIGAFTWPASGTTQQMVDALNQPL